MQSPPILFNLPSRIILQTRVSGLSQQVFQNFSDNIRSALAGAGIVVPTPPQTIAIPRILTGANVLLIAPTGSGKTEAVLLPILDQLMKLENRQGISIIYITPLRALNRDLLKRLDYWHSKLGFTVEVRHGDTPQKDSSKAIDQTTRLPRDNTRNPTGHFTRKTNEISLTPCKVDRD